MLDDVSLQSCTLSAVEEAFSLKPGLYDSQVCVFGPSAETQRFRKEQMHILRVQLLPRIYRNTCILYAVCSVIQAAGCRRQAYTDLNSVLVVSCSCNICLKTTTTTTHTHKNPQELCLDKESRMPLISVLLFNPAK